METDILARLRVYPGRRTLGELLQEREAAAMEIEYLRRQLARKQAAPAPRSVDRTTGAQDRRLLRLRDVCYFLSLSRSTIYKRISEDRFPEPIRLGERSVRWSAGAIEVWAQKHSR